ncbi:MAG: glycosyltransferase [Bacteroidia bacterium]|nr:glycosyltransferase [Bacteroidia bacterium]
MRILISHYSIVDQSGFGRTFMLARELVRLDHQVTLLTSLSSFSYLFRLFKVEEREGVKIIAFNDIVPNSMRRLGFGVLVPMLKFLYSVTNSFDIFHTDSGHRPSGGLPFLFRKVFRSTVYSSEWWDYFGKGGLYDTRKGLKKIFIGGHDLRFEAYDKRKADGLVCLSYAMRERAINLGIDAAKIIVLHGGADVRGISFSPESDLRQDFKISSETLVFGFVGMDDLEFEDVSLFLDVIQEVAQEERKEIAFLTTGEKINFEHKGLSMGALRILNFGWVGYEKLSEILEMADFFILTQTNSLNNSLRWPNKIGDYFAAGRPVIANDYGEISTLIRDFPSGFILTDLDRVELKRVIQYCLGNRFDLSRRISIRAYAENSMSWSIRARTLLEYFISIASHR